MISCFACSKPIDRKDALVGVNDNGHPSRYSYALLLPSANLYKRVFHENCYDEHAKHLGSKT